MKKLLFILVIAIYSSSIFSQGIVRGKVTDENGEAMIGVMVVAKTTPPFSVFTDFDGKFSIPIKDKNACVLSFSMMGYHTINDTINPKSGEVIIQNYTLNQSTIELKEAQVVGRKNKAKDSYMEQVKAKSAKTIDFISSETIKKTGDSRVDDAVKRVPGVSTVGSFITVRGVGDRYIKTTINGGTVPTLDPLTNNIKLDIFPSSLIDNIVLTKTQSADLPGDWGGAYISVETKDYPDKLTVNATTTFGYNDQTTFKNIVSSEKSKTDWLGYDDGMRNVSQYRTKEEYLNEYSLGGGSKISREMTFYDQVELIDKRNNTKIKDELVLQGMTRDNSDKYTKIYFNKLGLLAPAHFDDKEAYDNAMSQYQKQYSGLSDEFYAKAIANSKRFRDNLNIETRKAPLDFSQEFSIGDQKTLFGKPIGYIFGLRYSQSTKSDPNAIRYNRSSSEFNQELWYINHYNTSKETNQWSSLMNIAYKFNPNHSVSLLFMPNLVGANSVNQTLRDNYNFEAIGKEILVSNYEGKYYKSQAQSYEERKQLIYQFQSIHYFPIPKIKLDINVSYTDGKSNTPDFRKQASGYEIATNKPTLISGNPIIPVRSFETLNEDVLDARINSEISIGNKPGFTRIFKIGVFQRNSQRKFDKWEYGTNIGYNYLDFYDSNFGVNGAFALIDYTLYSRLRVSGGVRTENEYLFGDARDFKDVPKYSSPRGSIKLFIDGVGRDYTSNPLDRPQTNWLPNANIIYKLNTNDEKPLNFRLNYSKSLVRPSVRELTPFVAKDYLRSAEVKGNFLLKNTEIWNYDMRVESFFKNADYVSASIFFKKIKNHINFISIDASDDLDGYTWRNSKERYNVIGLELELKKRISKNFDLISNITFVDSRYDSLDYKSVKLFKSGNMYGQAPYIVNVMLNYEAPKLGLTATVSYNLQGPRITYFGYLKNPNIYEMPRDIIDFKISQKLGKHFNFSFKARSLALNLKWNNKTLLKTRNSYTQRTEPENFKYIYDSYNYGTDYSFSVSYNL